MNGIECTMLRLTPDSYIILVIQLQLVMRYFCHIKHTVMSMHDARWVPINELVYQVCCVRDTVAFYCSFICLCRAVSVTV